MDIVESGKRKTHTLCAVSKYRGRRRRGKVVEDSLPHYPGLRLRRFDRGRDAPYDRQDARLWGVVFVISSLCLIALVIWTLLL